MNLLHNDEIDQLAKPADAVREFVHNTGHQRPQSAWILSQYDTWEKNPYYHGPAQPHPEMDQLEFETLTPLEKILAKYPVRNSMWSLSADRQSFIAEAAEIEAIAKDPWGRSMQPGCAVLNHIERDEENEIQWWSYVTTVDKQPVQLRLLND